MHLMESLGAWARSKADTLLLLALFAYLFHGGAHDMAQAAFGALLLALTGGGARTITNISKDKEP
jgi:hypothetical protein